MFAQQFRNNLLSSITLSTGVKSIISQSSASSSLVESHNRRLIGRRFIHSTENETPPEPLFCGHPYALWRMDRLNRFVDAPQAWICSFDEIAERRLGIVDLHPDIFRVVPRIDLLHRNVNWQLNYRNVQFTKQLSRAEMPGGGHKPWPQKKMGRGHQGSIRAPHWKGGGFAHGVRGPRTSFYMLSDAVRLRGLCTALTVKHVQDDIVIVDCFDRLPDASAQFLHDLSERRNWGYSVLFVDVPDNTCEKLALACEEIPSFNIMPVYGLNCFSMMKHETLVLTLDALEYLETRLLQQFHRAAPLQQPYKYKDLKETIMNEGEGEDDPIHAPFV